jgi:type I restriction enzyme S subunit
MDNFFQIIPLGEVLRFGNGKSIKPGGSGKYLVYGSNGVIGGSDEYRHENGIIIGRVGAYCGSVSYCPSRFWASDNALVAFPSSDDHDTKFLYYLLVDAKLSRHAGGAAQPLVTQGVLKQVEAKVPPLPIQQRIAGILSAYDDLIENSQRRIKILEEMARRLYREWFVYFRFPGHEGCRLVESPLGEIPEGWEVKGFGRVTEITMGLSPKGDTYNEDGLGVPLVNGPVEFDERFTKAIKWTTSPTKVCRQGDLVVCVRGSTTGKYVKSDGTYCLGRGVASLSGAFQAFIDQLYVDQLPSLLRQASGSTFPSWTAPQLSGHPVVCPSPVILSAFERQASSMNELIYQYSASIQNLRRTRDLLLPRLLSGQIDVEALPEPDLTEP